VRLRSSIDNVTGRTAYWHRGRGGAAVLNQKQEDRAKPGTEGLTRLDTSTEARRGIAYWVSAWLPVAIAIAVIAIESTKYLGADHTSHPLRWLYEHLFGVVSDRRWDLLHHFIRKAGHFLGYGAVGLTWLRAWWMTLPQTAFFQDALLAVLGTALVAASDEYHQTFLPNRTGLARDVLLDCCGAVAMQLLVFLFIRLFRPKKLRRA
jgi:VanZ family protein